MSSRTIFTARFLTVVISILWLSTGAWAGTESVLHAFKPSTGCAPTSGVIFDVREIFTAPYITEAARPAKAMGAEWFSS